ncbi:RNA-binding S4 domain-containing protein [Malacoplasma penetrans]|uniref:RNA-binding S4 domain-containing protein n=1 Tax=Malacoplasma penetrans TaxID=28227 RepID=UPI00030AF2CA|nr:RNA-binding S4 domain-containing protein [Malacoplasma penetrans]RXY96883.1 RNA-binding S4 domain-containing protein [Malacoplasma penetrans]
MEKIYIKTPFIKLSQFLKFIGLIDNGSLSKIFIEENEIFVDGVLEKRRNKKLYENSVISINEKEYLIVNSGERVKDE